MEAIAVILAVLGKAALYSFLIPAIIFGIPEILTCIFIFYLVIKWPLALVFAFIGIWVITTIRG